jgi:tetratricopeptide (TPR) repeat protein
MPYRGLDRSGPACYRHDAAQASESCARCLQAICDICVGFENTQPHCPPCAQKVRRRRALGRALSGAVGFVAVAAIAGGVGWLLSREKPFDYGVYVGEVRALEENLSDQPCARPQMLKLADTMLRAGDYRGTLKKIKTFNVDCGEWPRLLWISYSAHERLSEHDAAIADVSRLIKLQPDDKDFWWWRAMAYEEKGELDLAVEDYRQSLEIEPRLTGIPFNLANLLERQGRFCEAMAPLNDFLHYHPDVRDRESVEARLDRLAPLCIHPQPVKK